MTDNSEPIAEELEEDFLIEALSDEALDRGADAPQAFSLLCKHP